MLTFNSFSNWITGVTGVGIVSWILLAIFAPSILNVLSSWFVALSPLFKGISEAIVKFFSILWEGLKDVADNLSTVIFVFTLLGLVYFYSNYNKDCSKVIEDLRKEYTFVKKKKW